MDVCNIFKIWTLLVQKGILHSKSSSNLSRLSIAVIYYMFYFRLVFWNSQLRKKSYFQYVYMLLVVRSTSMIFDDIGKQRWWNKFLSKLKLSISLQHGAKFNIFEYIPVYHNSFSKAIKLFDEILCLKYSTYKFKWEQSFSFYSFDTQKFTLASIVLMKGMSPLG